MMERQDPKPGRSRAGRLLAGLLIIVLAVLGLVAASAGGLVASGRVFILQANSMEPTLKIGDEVMAARYADGRSPARGDIVVFALPRDPHQVYIKRLIGLPGDRVQMRGGELVLNDAPVTRRAAGSVAVSPAVTATKYVETLPDGRAYEIIKGTEGLLDDTDVYVVPDGHYFVLGDNRDNSADSRLAPQFQGVGYVPAANLLGHVDHVLFSITPFSGWLDAMRDPADLRISRVYHPVR